MVYDAAGDAHYDSASALIKSLRGSDPDAALYWLARMLEGGEDVDFLCRRLIILASEDIGNADPQALPLAVAAMQACEFVGLPECQLNLAQAVTYLACAPSPTLPRSPLAKHVGTCGKTACFRCPCICGMRTTAEHAHWVTEPAINTPTMRKRALPPKTIWAWTACITDQRAAASSPNWRPASNNSAHRLKGES